MANGTRILALLIVLVVGLAGGWYFGSSRRVKVGDHLVAVGPTAKELDDDPAGISQKKGHTVRWGAKHPKHTLTIIFKAVDFDPSANGEPPFMGQDGQAQPRQDLVITCLPNSVCDPGPINTKLPTLKTDEKFTYKYWQKLEGPNGFHDQADGMIIIDP